MSDESKPDLRLKCCECCGKMKNNVKYRDDDRLLQYGNYCLACYRQGLKHYRDEQEYGSSKGWDDSRW